MDSPITFRLGTAIAVFLALIALVVGEFGPMLIPERLSLEFRGDAGQVSMEGSVHSVSLPDPRPGMRLAFEQPGPPQREYQIDGSDTTSRNDRNRDEFRAIQDAPWYRFLAWLRDEGSFSRWQDVRLIDLADGRTVATGVADVQSATLPAAFRLEAAVRRPEAPLSVWIQSQDGSRLAGLSLDRDIHQVGWNIGDDASSENTWFFPKDPWPFAAELMQMLGRSLAAAIVLLAVAAGLGWLITRGLPHGPRRGWQPPPFGAAVVMIVLVWLTAALWVTIRVYHQLPHIVDAEAYFFQARIFETGRTWLAQPDIVNMLDGFQQVEWDGRWYGQYPPGAPALYAVGDLIGLSWLVGPMATLALLSGTLATGVLLFERRVALAALGLLALSPFVLFQSGSFMSHPISGGATACALAAFAYGLRYRGRAAFILTGVLLGLAFNVREVTAVVYGSVFGVWLLATRRWRALAWIALASIPFLAMYLLFNLSTTGNMLTLPRNVFNPADRWGFGDVGVHGHTLAAGLVNTDENLTLLQFDLFGWPPLAAFALILMPFLLGRAGRYDWLLAACAGGFVVAYVGYFYHGIALGPRYYFEAVPALALLAARGLQVCVQTLCSLGLSLRAARAGTAIVLGGLCFWTLGYYLPHEIGRRMDFGQTNERHLVMPFLQTTLTGPQLAQVEPPALVAVPNDDVFKSLSALNCPLLEQAYLDQCPVLLVKGNLSDLAPLYARFRGRAVWLITTDGDLAILQRVRNAT